jgi:large subunit ribosomal protein L2
MAIRVYKPVTAGRRNASVNLNSRGDEEVTRRSRLLRPLSKSGGRTYIQGKIGRSFGKGGGHKRRYRKIDFRRNLDDVVAVVVGIEYDPNRSRAHIALDEVR